MTTVDLARYTALFLADGRDHLKRATEQLLVWERDLSARAPVDELFRSFHSLKGGAATMGFEEITAVAHQAEHLLEAVRRRELSGSPAIVGLLLRAVDALDEGLEPATQGVPMPDAALLSEAIARLTSTSRAAAPEPVADLPAERRTAEFPAMRSVRIDPARLDELLQLAGELVVTRTRLGGVAADLGDAELDQVASRMDTLVRALHAGVLRARLAPVTELFGRFPRLVRDLAASLGRVVRVEFRGDDVELDRSVIEALVDPLIHLVRNAVDHGIEPPDERRAAGKPEQGELLMMALRRRDWVVIRLSDDGRGIDRAGVAARARELGLAVPPAAVLDDEALIELLARPGFTLRREVTAVSGRGVGMDAVVTTVRALGGRLECHSFPGEGTVFEITVPLTTAIQRVLLVGVGEERYAIPSRLIREAAFPGRSGARLSDDGREFRIRGHEFPLVDLAPATGERHEVPRDRRPVLLLEWDDRSGAVAVDTLLGQHDVLIERIEAPKDMPGWVSGATILADGQPAFVLDPTALF